MRGATHRETISHISGRANAYQNHPLPDHSHRRHMPQIRTFSTQVSWDMNSSDISTPNYTHSGTTSSATPPLVRSRHHLLNLSNALDGQSWSKETRKPFKPIAKFVWLSDS